MIRPLQNDGHALPDPDDLLFVYGTLKEGGQYHHLLQREEARLVGKAVLVEAYPLILAQYPCLLDVPGRGHRVSGEVYRLPTRRGWSVVDRLEAHPVEYRRRREPVALAERTVEAWTYFYLHPDLLPAGLEPVPAFPVG